MLEIVKTGMAELDAFHEEIVPKHYDGLWRIGEKFLTRTPANVGVLMCGNGTNLTNC
ncbi:hypothetical protein [Paenibacillus sp. EPM92]|uniref:hypothetical protein n=1 Tax=Paenibacillus sp. EPM92 TaxID=1561195 RepID=UPI00191675D2|nr:hypothetical protein [Paenibacillus sp. EPM92]